MCDREVRARQPKKIVKYTEALRSMREDYPDGVVPRKAWASVVGKFQHVAEVVQGGSNFWQLPTTLGRTSWG